MNDSSKSGRWLAYGITSMDDLVIAEADRKLGDHIKALSVFNKVLQDAFCFAKFWNHYSFTVPSVVAQFPNLSFPIVQLEVLSIAELFRTLENAGEIGVSIALHTIDQEGRGVAKVKPCCFVLDAPKEKTLKKKAGLHNMLNQLTEFWKEKLCEQHSIWFQFLTLHLTRWDPLLHSEPGSTWQRSGIAPISRSAGVSSALAYL